MPAGEHDNGVRLDRWLWATRFFKTRTDATDAIRAGHVLLNDQRTRPAKSVRCDDVLRRATPATSPATPPGQGV